MDQVALKTKCHKVLRKVATIILTVCLLATLFSTTAFAATTIPSYSLTAVSSSESEIYWEGQCNGSVVTLIYHNGSSDKPVTSLSVEGKSYSLYAEPDSNGVSTFAVDTSGFGDGMINIRLWQRIATEHGYAAHYRGADLIPVSVSSGVASFYFPGGISEREFYNQLSLINSFEYDDVPKIYSTYGGYDIDTYIGLITAETEKIISGCRTNAEKVKAIHDWIATNIAYDFEDIFSGNTSHAADPIWVYANKRGVCSGYSRLARVMFGAAHIPCVNISGYTEQGRELEGNKTYSETTHEWNAVYFNGGWNLMDITWDSHNEYYGADSPKNFTGEAPRYVYYCISPENFSCDHSSNHITTYMKDPKDKCFPEQRYDLDYAPGMPDGVMIDRNTGGYVFVDDTLGIANYAAESVSDGKVFRMYNRGNGEHFYTRSVSERDALIVGGWVYESDGDFETVGAKEDAIPVYRMYNPNSGLHHYTLDKGEATSLKAVGWNFEGVAFYGYDKMLGKGTPLYREYNPNDGNHNYTTNLGEHNMLVVLGWVDEGIGFCVK